MPHWPLIGKVKQGKKARNIELVECHIMLQGERTSLTKVFGKSRKI